MTTTAHVAVLGTGRMGAAMATRLADRFPVVTWSRSGTEVPGVPAAPTAAAAVKDADVVVLALFDADACRGVLADCLVDVAAHAVVVNTATIGPEDAAAIAESVADRGVSYLHAPVLGSVPAVAGGTLTVLAGEPVDGPTAEVLGALGQVLEVGGPATAAALKLVAIGTLADGLLGVRDALRRSRAAGLPLDPTLSVLERTPLGGLVHAKRDRLTGARADAEFTLGALAKDLALLDAATGLRHRAAPAIEALRAGDHAEDDIAVLCTSPPAPSRQLPDARLEVRAGLDVPDEVLAPLHAYALGHATGSAEHFRRAFRPTAHIEGLRDGAFSSWDLDTYCALFDGPAPDEQERRRTVDSVAVTGTVATATMTLEHGPDRFTDVFLLVREADDWRIANKAYHRS